MSHLARNHLRNAVFFVAVLCCARVSWAQTLFLSPVEAGGSDVNALRTSLSSQHVDLRVPVDFDRVYKVTGDTRLLGRPGEEFYARVNNGVMAVFPRSTYFGSEGATVPPGTLWMLGANTRIGTAPSVPTGAIPLSGETMIRAVDRRVSRSVANDGRRLAQPIIQTPSVIEATTRVWVCMFASESIRQQRVGSRLDEAFERGQSRDGSVRGD